MISLSYLYDIHYPPDSIFAIRTGGKLMLKARVKNGLGHKYVEIHKVTKDSWKKAHPDTVTVNGPNTDSWKFNYRDHQVHPSEVIKNNK